MNKQPVAAQVALKHVMSWMFLRGGSPSPPMASACLIAAFHRDFEIRKVWRYTGRCCAGIHWSIFRIPGVLGAPDHAVLIVGYGNHRDGTPYWKVSQQEGVVAQDFMTMM